MNCPSLWIRAGGQVRNRRWADAARRQFPSAILVAVEGSAMLPSTNSSLSDALNPPVFVMLREVATTL
jgi:hypothetical protein